MASRTVKSAAGESIEIVDDADWLSTTGSNQHSLRMWNGMKPVAIAVLWEHGKFEEPNLAITRLNEAMAARAFNGHKAQQATITAMFRHPINAPAFKRIGKITTTDSIQLVALPEDWYGKLLKDLREAKKVEPKSKWEQLQSLATVEIEAASEESEPIKLEPDIHAVPFEHAPPAPAIDVDLASQVAMHLLNTVVEVINRGPSALDRRVDAIAKDLLAAQTALAQRLDENAGLRRRLQDAGDQINALQVQRNGLQQRLRSTEANLTAALKGDNLDAVNGAIHKAIENVMRATPVTKGE